MPNLPLKGLYQSFLHFPTKSPETKLSQPGLEYRHPTMTRSWAGNSIKELANQILFYLLGPLQYLYSEQVRPFPAVLYGRCGKKAPLKNNFFYSICSKIEQASEIKQISKYVLISVLQCSPGEKVKTA